MIKPPPTLMLPGPVGQLETIVLRPAGQVRGIALIAHPNPLHGGTHHNKVVQTVARTCVRQGYVAYCPNLRGVGASDGTHDYGRGEKDDMLAIARHAREQHGDLPLLLAGFSFGSFVQAQVAAELKPRQLILIGPATSKYAMPAVPADTVVIHGEADEVIPLQSVFDWARPQHLSVIVVPGVGHFFHGRLKQLQDLILHNWHEHGARHDGGQHGEAHSAH